MNTLAASDIFWMYTQLMKQDVDIVTFFLDDGRLFFKLSRPLDPEEARSFRGAGDTAKIGLVLVTSAIALKDERNLVRDLRPNATLQVDVSPDEGTGVVQRLWNSAHSGLVLVNAERKERERTTDEEERVRQAEQRDREREAERAARQKAFRAQQEAEVEELKARLGLK